MSDSKKDGAQGDNAKKPKQQKRPPVEATHVTQPFLNVRVPKGASKKTVETAVIQALDDKVPTFVNNSQGDAAGTDAASLKPAVDVSAAAHATANPESSDPGGGTKDTKFFKDEKDALLMIVNQEGL